MANIFSGLFDNNRPGLVSSALKNARYKQKLDDYKIERDTYQQGQALDNIQDEFQTSIADMTPERQRQMLLNMQMARQHPMFDKGMEGIGTGLKQRGTTIADILKQDKELSIANAKHQYKVDHPLPGDVGAKLEYAKAYIGEENYNRLAEAGDWDQIRLLMDRAARARQMIDLETHWYDPVSGDRYDKETGERILEETFAKDIGGRVTSFIITKKSRDQQMIGFDEYIRQLEKLDEGADWTNTGLVSAALSWAPGSPQRDWKNTLDTVNAKSVMEAMMTLKALSATGATGFGAVNLRELETMQDNWGKLDALSSPGQIKDVIKGRLRVLKKIRTALQKDMSNDKVWFRNNRRHIPAKYQSAYEPIMSDTFTGGKITFEGFEE